MGYIVFDCTTLPVSVHTNLNCSAVLVAMLPVEIVLPVAIAIL
jgi:hypothetical protein